MAILYIHGQAEIPEGLEIPLEVVSNILSGADMRHDRCSERAIS